MDFGKLQTEIEAASRQAFRDVARAHPAETICAFALYSDEDAITVCPAFDLAARREARIVANQDVEVETFCTPEWALEAFGAREAFAAICTTARTHVTALGSDEQAHAAFRDELFETCKRALENLRAEGVIGADLLVMFAVSDSSPTEEDEIRMMERLNGTSPYVAQFRRWVERWAVA